MPSTVHAHSPITTLYVVRHGETDYNAVGRFQGHIDRPLTAAGLAQADALASRFRDLPLDVIYSSDLIRARATGEAVGSIKQLPVNCDERLRERHLGVLQGMSAATAREQCPDVWRSYKGRNPDYRIPDGETRRECHVRILEALEEIVHRHPGKAVLVTAHGGILDSIFRHVNHIPLDAHRRWRLWNAALNRFSHNSDGWRLDTWGDITHLAGSGCNDDY
ncbi:MAG: histidine phosphatase family protein [Verrucomicrobiota bacterium]|nr:histidine phosphatase family protein [Verrucomicrobiota bacterium]